MQEAKEFERQCSRKDDIMIGKRNIYFTAVQLIIFLIRDIVTNRMALCIGSDNSCCKGSPALNIQEQITELFEEIAPPKDVEE